MRSKTALARYRDQETKVEKLGEMLIELEQTNRDRTHRALCTTLMYYGAEDDIHRWTHAQRDTTPQIIQQMLNDRWSHHCMMVQSNEQKRPPFLVKHIQCPSIDAIKINTGSRKEKSKKVFTTKQSIPRKTQELDYPTNTPRATVADQTFPNIMEGHKQGKFQDFFNQWMDAKLEESYCTRSQLKVSHIDPPASSGGTSDTSSLSLDSSIAKENSDTYDEIHSADEDIPLGDHDEDDSSDDNNHARSSTMAEQVSATLTMETLSRHSHYVKSLISTKQYAVAKEIATKGHGDPSSECHDANSKEHLLNLIHNEISPAATFANDSNPLSRMTQSHAEMKILKPLVKLDKPIFLGFVMQRAEHEPHWGISFSLEYGILIVSHLTQNLVQTFTKQAKASIVAPRFTEFNLDPATFLDGLQNDIGGPHTMKPGDVVLSINGRLSPMFSSVTSVTEYIKHFELLGVVVLRAQRSLENPDKDQIFDTTQLVYNSLEANGLMPLATGGVNTTNVPQSSDSPETAPDLESHNALHIYPRMVDFQALESMTGTSVETTYPAHEKREVKSSARLNTKYTKRTSPHARARHRSSTTLTNHLFHNPHHSNMERSDEDGLRPKHIHLDMSSNNFYSWLLASKREWRRKWTGKKIVNSTFLSQQPVYFPGVPINPMVENQTRRSLTYGEIDGECTVVNHNQPYGSHSFSSGTRQRELGEIFDASNVLVRDNWTTSHFGCWDNSLDNSYTDNNEIVIFSSPGKSNANFKNWLIIRKNQWKIQLRMRQQRKWKTFEIDSDTVSKGLLNTPRCVSPSNVSFSCARADASLERIAGENRLTQLNNTSISPSLLFDAHLETCDEIIGHCFGFLRHSERIILLCLGKATRKFLKNRDEIWHQLCSAKWNLAERPRKTYYDLYMAGTRKDEKHYCDQSDKIFKRATIIMSKGDHVQKMETLLENAKMKFGFDINHVPRVCSDNNSILNFAVISRRSGIVKWLVESKEETDLESRNKGGFTPIMNAHWCGDLCIFDYLLRRGCDHTKIGSGLYHSQPFALIGNQLLEVSIQGRQDICNTLQDFE